MRLAHDPAKSAAWPSAAEYAELRESLDYGPAREVRAAFLRLKVDPLAMIDLDMVLVRAFVTSWHVLNTAGEPVPIDRPELAGDDAIQAIARAAVDLWNKGKAPPKAETPHSPHTPPARP